MKQANTFSQYLDNFISGKIALTLKNQGTKRPNGNWHQIDLRGNGLIIKHCSSDLEAHLARFLAGISRWQKNGQNLRHNLHCCNDGSRAR